MTLPNYQSLYDSMEVRPEFENHLNKLVALITAGKDRYKAVCQHIPWQVVGILHYREATCSFSHHLHNGDPLTGRTVHVPPGRPLFPPAAGFPKGYTFEESALDALTFLGLYQVADWDLVTVLKIFEEWNGWGYLDHGINSPYVWGWTSLYTAGAYVSDHNFQPDAVNDQCGAAPLYKALTTPILTVGNAEPV